MYFRKKTSAGRGYLQIVESRREGAAVRQQVIATLGRIDELQASGQLERLLRSGARFAAKAIVLDAVGRGEAATVSTRRIGPARARRFFLLGETMDADAALSAGLVDYVVDDDSVVAEAEKTARELAAGPTEAYGGIKRLFLQTLNRPMESQMEDEAQTLAAISRTADAQEGIRAFKEKRKPKFAGK